MHMQRTCRTPHHVDALPTLPQVGTASLDLSPLLRQGREFSELLVELPIMLHEQQQPQTAQQVGREGRRGGGGFCAHVYACKYLWIDVCVCMHLTPHM